MDEPATGGEGAIEALRSMNGLTLVVWPVERRRAALPAGRGLADLSAAEHEALREAAVGLTTTETLLARDDAWWLVQQTGPAWADPGEASAELCGLLFTRLDGSGHRERIGGMPPGPLPAEPELLRLLEQIEAERAAGDGDSSPAT